MFRLLLLVCVGVVAVRANLTGVTVATGDCLCVSGTGVNARDHGESRAVAFFSQTEDFGKFGNFSEDKVCSLLLPTFQ